MKKILVVLGTIILINLSPVISIAQTEISLAFNYVDIGRNLSLSGTKSFSRHKIQVGIKYGINSFEHDNQNNLFKKRFFATDFIEHWGAILGYQYAFKPINNYVIPFLLYEMQLTNSHTRNDWVFPVGYDTDGNVLYRKYLDYLGPTVALENYIGFGLNISLSEHLFITQKAGGGIALFYKTDPTYAFKNNRSWEFGYMLSLGLAYRFKSNND